MLPGPWILAFLPDILLPILAFHGWKTDRLMSHDNELIKAHKFFHTVYLPMVSIFLFMVTQYKPFLWLGSQWLVHVVIDIYTHPEPQFQKDLW